MKLNPKQSLTHPLISEYLQDQYNAALNRPTSPTPEAVAKAQFVDKTYNWKGSEANKAADVQPNI